MRIKITLLAIVLATTVVAEEKAGYYTGINFGLEESNTGGSDSTKWSGKFGKHINKHFDAELYTRTKDKDTGSNDTRVEAAIIGKHKLTDDWSSSLRFGVGNKYTRTDDFGYWSITPTVKYKINNKWSTKIGYRLRDAFETERKQNDQTLKLGLSYKIVEDTSVSAGYDWKRGDSDANGLAVGFKFEF